MSRLERSALVAASLSAFLLAACSAGAVSTPSADATAPSLASPSATGAPAGGPITVHLREGHITLSSVSAPAGAVTFEIKNVGTAFPHEFVLIRTDLDAADLPTKDLKAIEDGLDIVDKVQNLQLDQSASLTVNLGAGHYVIICNISGHYVGFSGRGMQINFDVT